jgi:2-isopropylmalate synthase
VAAAFCAIGAATGIAAALERFDIRNVTVGEDAQGEAVVSVAHDGRIHQGIGLATDIIEASAQAYLQAINRICASRAAAPAMPDCAAGGAA